MKKLTEEQLREYMEKGYTVVPDVFTRDELSDMDDEINRIQNEGYKNGNEGWVFDLANRSEKTKQFVRDDRILTLIEDIVKPGIAIYSSKLTAKMPQSDVVCHWHQDDAYYTRVSASDVRMSVWVPLQDSNEKNGCLWVVPESHKWGLAEHEIKKHGTCVRSLIEMEHDFSNAIPVPVEAGSIVLFSALTWHSSKENQTDKIRRAFIISYQEATVTAGNGKQWEILRAQ